MTLFLQNLIFRSASSSLLLVLKRINSVFTVLIVILLTLNQKENPLRSFLAVLLMIVVLNWPEKCSLFSGIRPGGKFFITHLLAMSNVYQNIHFQFKKKTKITRRQKSKRTKKKREYLGKILRNTTISFANLLCCLLTYPPNFSWLFTCNERNRSIRYTTTTYVWSTHLQEQRSKKIIKSLFCLSFSFLYLYFCSGKFVIVETSAYDIAHDENAISSWKQAPEFYNKSFS